MPNRFFVSVLFCFGFFYFSFSSVFATSDRSFGKEESFQQQIPIYRDSIFYQYCPAPCVIFLAPSSTGKTTLISQLRKNHALERYTFTGFDQILHDLDHDFYDQSDMFRKVNYYFRKILIPDSIMQNKGLIIDTVSSDIFINGITCEFIRCPIYVFSLYVSPKQMSTRLEKRNIDSLENPETGFRTFVPFNQYVDIFEKVKHTTDICLTKQEIISANIFDKLKEIATRFPDEFRERLIEAIQRNLEFQNPYYQKMLEYFSHDEEQVYLTPRIHFSYTINMSHYINLADLMYDWLLSLPIC